MFKKFLCLILVIITCFSICACDEDKAVETPSPEETVKDYLTAMYSRDAEGLLKHFPDYVLEATLKMAQIAAEDGDSHEALLNYFKEQFAEDPVKTEEIDIETRLSTTATKEDYMKIVNEYYISEDFATESDIEKIEDVVFVEFNCHVKFDDGSEVNLKDFKQKMPCIKIGDKWYVDILYSVMIISEETAVHTSEEIKK